MNERVTIINNKRTIKLLSDFHMLGGELIFANFIAGNNGNRAQQRIASYVPYHGQIRFPHTLDLNLSLASKY